MINTRVLRAIEAISVLLFFLRGMRVLFSMMFGILYDQLFAGTPDIWLPVTMLLVVLAFLAPAVATDQPTRRWMMVVVFAAALGSIGLSVNDAPLRFVSSLIAVAAGGLYLAGLLTARRLLVLPSLLLALGLDQVMRAVGHTFDVAIGGGWLPIQLVWAGLIVFFALFLGGRRGPGEARTGVFSRRAAVGLGALLFLETSLFGLPNAVTHWADVPYAITAPAILVLTALPLSPAVRHAFEQYLLSTPVRRAALGLILAGCLLAGYFVNGAVALVGLLVGQVIVLALLVLIIDGRPPMPRPVGPPLAGGLAVLLGLVFLNGFAFTYPYTLPILRGMGWMVYLLAALLLAWSAFHQRPGSIHLQVLTAGNPRVLSLILASILVVGVVAFPRPAAPLPQDGVLRAATYNIHYGFDAEWKFNLQAMAELIETNEIDVIALQEVDTGRLTSFAVDDAYYLGRRLGMNVAYLPTVEHLTGIALLYKGPLVATDAAMLTSLQEQTGIVHAPLRLGEDVLHAYGTWLGLEDEDTLLQVTEALTFIGDSNPATFGGDFNAELGSPVANAVQAAGFEDPFSQLGIDPAPNTDPAVDPIKRIDFVWLRDATALQAWVPDSTASDHRMVVTEIRLR
jgi:endonuclease/exonuclease/phosphatase family metal-dependent hydrolase